ncbi:ras-related protein Rab-32-like [Panonychus citri]|uniref:ras-related protein Rab-32-like n=1 Tax=Panonychus citri TaxID=50023 RepID=UPI00230759F5|nr:ras-related protein Rab-32-like [Panonychus citri]
MTSTFYNGAADQCKEYLFKILVIGEIASGKTSFVKRYVHKLFSTNYRSTIGVDFALKAVKWSDDKIVRIQLWDIAGQERFGNMTRVYYKEAVGAFIVCDVTRKQTLDAIPKWKADLDSKVTLSDGSRVPTVLLLNKCDMDKGEWAQDTVFLDSFCRDHGIEGWFYTSAKENINIDEAAQFLITLIMQKQSSLDRDDNFNESIKITRQDDIQTKKSCC